MTLSTILSPNEKRLERAPLRLLSTATCTASGERATQARIIVNFVPRCTTLARRDGGTTFAVIEGA